MDLFGYVIVIIN